MSKVTFVAIVAVAAVCAQGLPLQYNELAEAARSGNWEKFRQILTQNVGFDDRPISLTDDIRTLRGGPDTHVYGHAVSTFKSSSNVNGRQSEFSAGHKVINNDGQIEEYDFRP